MFENKFIVRKEFILENRDNENFVVIDARGDMLKAGDVQAFFADICKKYIVLV